MTISEFKCTRLAVLDAISPTTPGPGLFRVGAIISGAAKTVNRMQLLTADLAAVADVGPPMPANAAIVSAALWGNVTAILGGSVTWWCEGLARDRALYDNADATHLEWDAGATWRIPGGRDIVSSPAPQSFSTPANVGDQLIVDVQAFAIDALANREGLLQLHLRLDNTGPTSTIHFTVKSSPTTDSDVARIRVVWNDPQPLAVDHPQGVTLPGGTPTRAAAPASSAGGVPPAPPAQPTRRPHGR